MIGSPETGRQHLARRSGTSATPSTRMPYLVASDSGRRRAGALRGIRSSAAERSSAASPAFRRESTLLTTTFGEIFAPPSAM